MNPEDDKWTVTAKKTWKLNVCNVISNLYSSLTVEHSNMFHNLAVLCDNMTLILITHAQLWIRVYALCASMQYVTLTSSTGDRQTLHICLYVCVCVCVCERKREREHMHMHVLYASICFLSCVSVTKIMMHWITTFTQTQDKGFSLNLVLKYVRSS